MKVLNPILVFVLFSNLFDTTYAACGDVVEGCSSEICYPEADRSDCFCQEDSDCDDGIGETCQILGESIGRCHEDSVGAEDLILCASGCDLCVEQSDPFETVYVCYCFDTTETCPTGFCVFTVFESGDGEFGICIPPSSGDDATSSGGCFSDRSTCIEEQKGKMFVKDLMVGDKVLTRSGRFQTVYTLDHVDTRKKTEFLQISYQQQNNHHHKDNDSDDASLWSGGGGVLELTPSHMVFVHGKADPVAASQLLVGDVIETKKEIIASPIPHHNHDKDNFVSGLGVVQKISKITRKGLWNPITTDGTIVVDGVTTSTYSAITFGTDQEDRHGTIGMGPSYISIGGINLVSQHTFLHTLMGPFRFVCVGLSLSLGNEYHNGLNVYSYTGNKLLDFARKQGNEVSQGLMLSVVFLSCNLLSFMFSLPGAATFFTVAYSIRIGSKRN